MEHQAIKLVERQIGRLGRYPAMEIRMRQHLTRLDMTPAKAVLTISPKAQEAMALRIDSRIPAITLRFVKRCARGVRAKV